MRPVRNMPKRAAQGKQAKKVLEQQAEKVPEKRSIVAAKKYAEKRAKKYSEKRAEKVLKKLEEYAGNSSDSETESEWDHGVTPAESSSSSSSIASTGGHSPSAGQSNQAVEKERVFSKETVKKIHRALDYLENPRNAPNPNSRSEEYYSSYLEVWYKNQCASRREFRAQRMRDDEEVFRRTGKRPVRAPGFWSIFDD